MRAFCIGIGFPPTLGLLINRHEIDLGLGLLFIKVDR